MARLCCHCRAENAVRSRGLGMRCYSDPAIRGQYQAPPPRLGAVDFNGGYGLPDRPTEALAGTQAKEEAMARRVEQRVQLHHPLDARR